MIGSSTTPTLPFGVNTLGELIPMTMTVHRQNPAVDSDVAVSRGRVRSATIEAENLLQDLGAIPVINSDAMGMGRIGELVRRTWQLASRRLAGPGAAAPAGQHADNERVLRYLAKLTINPALAHGLADHVGSLEPGKLADVVLWHPAFFGAKPELVLKSGFVAWGVSGDGAGSTRLGQPRKYRPYFGGLGDAPASLAAIFVAASALEHGFARKLPGRRLLAVRGTRHIRRSDMLHNIATPRVEVPTDGTPVRVNGAAVHVDPVTWVPLGQLYHLA